MSTLFSVLACINTVAAVAIYFIQIKKGQSTPNPTTWIVRSVVLIMNSFTYFYVVGGGSEFWMPATVAVCITTVACYSLLYGKFTERNMTDVVCFVLTILVGIFWKATNNPVMANVLLQVILVGSLWPTANGLLRNPKARERAFPWFMGTFSYVLLLISVLLDWENNRWEALVLPIFNGFCGNGSIAVLILWRNRRKV